MRPSGLDVKLSPMKNPPQNKPFDKIPPAFDLIPRQPLLEQAVGIFVMRLSFVHFILEINLWSLLGINTGCGRILTEDLPLTSLANRLYRTVQTKNPHPDTLKQLRKAMNELEKINQGRNALVHGFWTFPKDGPPSIVPKKGQVISKDAPTYSEIRRWIEDTDRFTEEFLKCMNRINNPELDLLVSRSRQP